MAFMVPEYFQGKMIRFTRSRPTRWPSARFGEEDFVPQDEFSGIDQDGVKVLEILEGWFCRLNAPGYLDCTSWCGPHESKKIAEKCLAEDYSVCSTCGETLEEDEPGIKCEWCR